MFTIIRIPDMTVMHSTCETVKRGSAGRPKRLAFDCAELSSD